MSKLEITGREYNTYLRVKEIIEKNDYKESDLIPLLKINRGLTPTHIPLIIQSDDMKPTKYNYLTEAAKGIKVSFAAINYAHKRKRPQIVRRKGGTKIFYIEWLER